MGRTQRQRILHGLIPVVVLVGLLCMLLPSPGTAAVAAAAPEETSFATSLPAWELQDPPADWSTLRGVWGTSSSDVFAVGDRGAILYSDGIAWSALASGTTNDLAGVWGSSSSNVFAVGAGGTILHYGGTEWSAMTSGTTNDLAGVWGSSSSDVFAVGASGTILHYDGSTWIPITSGTAALHGVWGSSSSDVFAVGASGTILHYDGSTWSPMSSGALAALHSVWGDSSYIYVVGESGTIRRSLVGSTTWDGMISGTSSTLYSIWGSSSSNVFAAGTAGKVFRCDGSTWSSVPYADADSTLTFRGVWGSSSSNVLVVGDRGTILDYDGIELGYAVASWSHDLVSVWGSSASNVHAIGPYGAWLQYDGSSWSLLDGGGGPPADIEYEGQKIWGSSPSDMYIVGTAGLPEVASTCDIRHYDGSTWTGVYLDISGGLSGVWGSSASDVFAVGSGGTVLHSDGSIWSPMINTTDSALFGIWGSAADDVFAVGSGGTVLRYDGNSGSVWSPMTEATANDLVDIWGSASNDAFAVGDYGTILHYNGSAWIPMSSGTASNLAGIWGRSATDVFAVGDGGVILHYDGSTWTSMTSNTTNGLADVWGSSATEDVFAVGDDGAILHYGGPIPPVVSVVSTENVTTISARLNGNLSSLGTASSVQVSFEWDLTTNDNATTPETYDNTTTPETMTNTGDFSFTLTDLAPATTYHFRAKAEGDGIGYGDNLTFMTGTTSAAPPTVATNVATGTGTTAATLNGDLTGLGSALSVQVSFEWGLTTDYGNVSPPEAMDGTGSFSYALSGLAPATTYHFRARAVGDDTAHGSDLAFITGIISTTPPAVATGDADGIAADSARLNGDLTSMGTAGSVTVSFVWGITLGGPYPNETAGAAQTGSGAFHSDLGGLAPGTTYYYQARVVGDGSSHGAEKSFTTTGKAPLIESLTVDKGRRGEDLTIAISGSNLSNVTKVDFGAGITVSEFSAVSDSEITAKIAIESGAEPGARDITVTTPWGTATVPDGFLVNGASTRVHLWVYLVAVVGGMVGLGILASLGLRLRRRSAR